MPDLIIAGLIQFQLIVKRISTVVCNIVWYIIRLICKTTAAAATIHTNRIRTAAAVASQHRSNEKMINKTYKLLFGIVLLLIVDIIWVSSSELTKVRSLFLILNLILVFVFIPKNIIFHFIISSMIQFLYQNEGFDKPFFCTYFKTSMFTLYLLVLGLIAPWKNCDPNRNNYTVYAMHSLTPDKTFHNT